MLALTLTGCAAVGPDYKGPPATQIPARFNRAGQDALQGQPQAAWWRTLSDPVLDRLVEAAIDHNDDVRLAMNRIDEERALLRGKSADFGPSGDVSAKYARTRPYLVQFGEKPADNQVLDVYRTGLDASWELDMWGGKRRGVEATRAMVDAARANLDDVRVSIASEVAQAYVDLRLLQVRLDHLHQVAAQNRQLVELVDQRHAEGMESDIDVGRTRYELRLIEAEEPGLRSAVAVQMDRLAVLTGEHPGALDAVLSAPADIPVPPATVTVDDPASLLRRRPDIRAAERMIAAATAHIGVATAELFPKVTLNGNIGFASLDLDSLGASDTKIYSIGPTISWGVFDMARIRAQIARADTKRQAMVIRYEKAVKLALADSEASLVNIANSRETLVIRQNIVKSAHAAALLTEQRYHEGHVSLRDVIAAHRQETLVHERQMIAEADVTKAYIAVQKSLGLAWAEPPQP